jgi:hypothetical protein
VPLQSWWQIELSEPIDTCEWALDFGTAPTRYALGIGQIDSKLYPAMQANGYDPEAVSLNALYVQLDGSDTVYVFGVAGTDAQFAGTEVASDVAPLPDGTYNLDTLHLLPL